MAARKNRAWLALPFFALLVMNAHAGEAINLKLENHLAACIKIDKPTMYSADGILFAKISYVQKDLTAGCSCKSAVSTFMSTGGKKERHAFLMGGNLQFGKGGTMKLPLLMEHLGAPDNTIKLTITCANPE